MLTIYCPNCENPCIEGDDNCSLCGHALRHAIESIDKLIAESIEDPLTKALERPKTVAVVSTPPKSGRNYRPEYNDRFSRGSHRLGRVVIFFGVLFCAIGLSVSVVCLVSIFFVPGVGGSEVAAASAALEWGIIVSAAAVSDIILGAGLLMLARIYELLHDIAAHTGTKQP